MSDIGPGDEVICIDISPGSDTMPAPLVLYATYVIRWVGADEEDGTPICTLVSPQAFYDCPIHGHGEYAFQLSRFVKRGEPKAVTRKQTVCAC